MAKKKDYDWLKIKNFPLYQRVHGLILEMHKFLEKVFLEREKFSEDFIKLKKEIEELNWYHTFFDVKLYRALSSKEEAKRQKDKMLKKFDMEDANRSAKLAFESLSACQRTLEKFSQNCPGFTAWTKDLALLVKNILKEIESEFPNLHKSRIIFHA